MRPYSISMILFFSVMSSAANITENLPAGGKFVFESKWDHYTILCTAEPVVPTLVSKSCTCTQYDMAPVTGAYRYRLSLSSSLSNGKTTQLILSDGNDLKTLADCERQKVTSHADVCRD